MPSHRKILARRIALGLTQQQVADILAPHLPGFNRFTLSKIERGARRVFADELPFLAKALRCRPGDLVDPLPD